MKTATATVLLVLAGIIGGGLGLGYEATFFMFSDDYRYRVAEGTPLLRASVSYIVTNFMSAYGEGLGALLICACRSLAAFPFLCPEVPERADDSKGRSADVRNWRGCLWDSHRRSRSYAMIGGWAPSGLIGLALSGLFIGFVTPFLFGRREGPNSEGSVAP